MQDQANQSRRSALKFLSGLPIMLPLGSSAALSLLAACGGSNAATTDAATGATAGTPSAAFASARFTGMAAPSLANPAEMATTLVKSAMTVTLADGSTHEYALAYAPFFITGDMVEDGNGGKILAGGYVDIHNRPIIDNSVPATPRQFFSDSPDGTSLIALDNATVAGIKGRAVFAVVQFEYTTRDLAGADTYGALPSPIAVLTLDQNQATGKLTLVKYHNVDTSAAHGLWITCGASLSPWNTHLSSEEYEPDAFAPSGTTAASIKAAAMFARYSTNVFGNAGTANPYHYGHLPEITVNPDGSGSCRKHYCMGRISHELIQVMPDMRTVLMGDDYTNGGLFLFVADRARDLSAGKLYVARLGSGFSLDPGAAGAPLSWILLGHASSAEIENLAGTLRPGDIMSVLYADPHDASYTRMYCDGMANWVRLNPGMEKAAAFLETHRYASLAGGSMGFTKLEGTTVNARDKIAYSALQNIQASMVRGNAAWSAASNITVPSALIAGGVMAHTLAGGQTDTAGAAMDSEWVPVLTRMLLVGEDISADGLGNTANPEKVANPDNLKFSETMRTLFIGEDSGSHVNNFLWAYNVDTRELARLMSLPAGAESTGLQAVDEINGWTYIMSNFQHPGDWSAIHGVLKPVLDPLVRANYKNRYGAAVGYLTADPHQMALHRKP
ncbi:MAG: PhoX family protein [Janthinobacterium lividum]